MYITNITGVKHCKVHKNCCHPEVIKEERIRKLDDDSRIGNGVGKEFVSTWFNIEREGKIHVDLIPLECEGKLEIYVDYFPGEGGNYSIKIVMDIENGDEITNTLEKGPDFHSKFPFTKNQT